MWAIPPLLWVCQANAWHSLLNIHIYMFTIFISCFSSASMGIHQLTSHKLRITAAYKRSQPGLGPAFLWLNNDNCQSYASCIPQSFPMVNEEGEILRGHQLAIYSVSGGWKKKRENRKTTFQTVRLDATAHLHCSRGHDMSLIWPLLSAAVMTTAWEGSSGGAC